MFMSKPYHIEIQRQEGNVKASHHESPYLVLRCLQINSNVFSLSTFIKDLMLIRFEQFAILSIYFVMESDSASSNICGALVV